MGTHKSAQHFATLYCSPKEEGEGMKTLRSRQLCLCRIHHDQHGTHSTKERVYKKLLPDQATSTTSTATSRKTGAPGSLYPGHTPLLKVT